MIKNATKERGDGGVKVDNATGAVPYSPQFPAMPLLASVIARAGSQVKIVGSLTLYEVINV